MADGSPNDSLDARDGCRIGHNGKVQYWKPHALATPHEGQIDLKMGDKVRTTAEVHGVPVGTEGKVLLANGFNWLRYRVLFDNGAEVGDLDHRNIEPIGRAAKRVAKRAKIAARGF
jgi:hypothetical protein